MPAKVKSKQNAYMGELLAVALAAAFLKVLSELPNTSFWVLVSEGKSGDLSILQSTQHTTSEALNTADSSTAVLTAFVVEWKGSSVHPPC